MLPHIRQVMTHLRPHGIHCFEFTKYLTVIGIVHAIHQTLFLRQFERKNPYFQRHLQRSFFSTDGNCSGIYSGTGIFG
ncbi:hypothetical protein SDC9_205743 [bioreactor metagenome]|uniref:Uncharacterized protein n=1 Tax=bioreactor metagenome TaxID=1076179 RepID=A0A645J3M2_9ZZZZ